MISCAGMRRALHIFLRNFYPLLNISHHDGSRYIEESSNPVLNFNLLPRRYLKRRVEKEFVAVRKFTLLTFPVERNWRTRWGKVECRNAFDPCTAVAPNKLPHEFPQEQMYEGRFSKRFSNAHARVCAAYYLRGCQRVRIIRTRCHISGWGPCHL